MRYIVLKGSFDEQFMTKILDHVNEVYYDTQNKQRQSRITIYISSGGGSVALQQILTDVINDQPERFRVIAVEHIQSAAFRFFFEVECDKCVLPNCIGMYHVSREDMEIGMNGEPYHEVDKFLLKNFPEFMKEDLRWCESIGMTAAEIEGIASGKCVYFSTEDIKRLIKTQKDVREEKEKRAIEQRSDFGNG